MFEIRIYYDLLKVTWKLLQKHVMLSLGPLWHTLALLRVELLKACAKHQKAETHSPPPNIPHTM